MSPPLCSRNAHDQNVLVRRAQSRIDQATLENEMGNWEGARSEEQSAYSSWGSREIIRPSLNTCESSDGASNVKQRRRER